MRWLGGLFASLELIGLAAWIGGMLTLGALVAPTVFNTVKPIEAAGDAMSLIFHQFNGKVAFACIALVAFGFLGKFLWVPRSNRGRWIEAGVLAVMVLTGLYIGAILGPRMQELRQVKINDPSNGMAIAEFDRGHSRSVQLYSVNLFLGIAALVLNGIEIAGKGRE